MSETLQWVQECPPGYEARHRITLDADGHDTISACCVEIEPPALPDDATIEETLASAAAWHQSVRFNSAAALQQAIVLDGFCPSSDEFDIIVDEVTYRAQRAQHPWSADEARVYYARLDDWLHIRYVML